MSIPSRWKDITRRVTSVDRFRFENRGRQPMSSVIGGLSIAADYEAIVKVKNKYGWSKDSKPFRFSTRICKYK